MATEHRGTIVAAENFDAEREAKKLQRALKGTSANGKQLGDILTACSSDQRLEIQAKYLEFFHTNLHEDVHQELGGHFEDACLALLISYTDLMVTSLHRAVHGLTTDEKCVVDILCTHRPQEVKEMKSQYKKKYDEDLDTAMSKELNGDFRKMVLMLLGSVREERSVVQEDVVQREAQQLYDAGVDKAWGTDEGVFLKVMCQRSYAALRAIFTAYGRISGHDIQNAIRSEFSGGVRRALLALVASMASEVEYFSCRLYECMKGIGTDDKTLIRTLVSRSEVDLQDIKIFYKKKYGKELADAVADDTSGDYRKLLLQIISGNR